MTRWLSLNFISSGSIIQIFISKVYLIGENYKQEKETIRNKREILNYGD